MSSRFRSFFVAGFECSTHRLRPRGGRPGRRLDMVAASGHEACAAADYARCLDAGIRTAREGLRWHLVERAPGRYDWSRELPRLRAARAAGVHVVWDLFHYGWPDGLDIFAPAFVDRFAAFARAFAELHRDESDEPVWVAPVNEPSFVAWAGGDVAYLDPFKRGRGVARRRRRQLLPAQPVALPRPPPPRPRPPPRRPAPPPPRRHPRRGPRALRASAIRGRDGV